MKHEANDRRWTIEIVRSLHDRMDLQPKSDTPCIASVLSLVLRGPRFTMTHLNGAGVEDFVVK